MLIKQYEHRLPSDYDMSLIRARGRTRGPVWDSAAGLAFKAFALRERGQHGARHNAYTSIYLWLDEDEVTRFMTGPRFEAVLESFGRPPIQTWLPLVVRTGRQGAALSIYRDDVAVGENVDLSELSLAETERSARLVTRDDVLVSLVGIDAFNWKLARFTLSSAPLQALEGAIGYEIAYLAAPGLSRLAAQPEEAALI
jgi:hypothetical protein